MNLHAPSRRFTSIYVPFAFPAGRNVRYAADTMRRSINNDRFTLCTRAKREERKNTMRKLTMLAVVLVLVVGVLAAVVPALCHLGSDGGSCDVVSALRGGIRLANSERCQQTPRPVDCAVTGVAGLERK